MKWYFKLGLFLAPFVVLGVLVLAIYGYINSNRGEAINQENRLTAQYLSCQNYLSAFISGFYEQLGVANLKSDKLDKILTDYVKGRYGAEGFSAKGAFFAAVKETAPELTGLNVYDKLMDYISAKREGYKNIQDKLLDMLATYKNFKDNDIIRSIVLKFLGFPSTHLQAKVDNMVYTGQAALDKMEQIVLTEQAIDAYKTGKMAPMKVQ